jgi:CRISPR-associated protein Csm3
MSNLLGKIMITGTLTALTGLRVGGATGGLKIGGVDLNVITDPQGKPYIPGSSIKGKTRALAEYYKGVQFDGKGRHLCNTDVSYNACPVCQIWGTMGGKELSGPCLTRLQVRDAFLDESSIPQEIKDNIELEWTEVKFETAINRIKGTAQDGSLRQVERVPAGARFSLEFILNVFLPEDLDNFKLVLESLQLLEHDYLGGMGSRGYGRVEITNLEIYFNSRSDYEAGTVEAKPERQLNGEFTTPASLLQNFEELKKTMDTSLPKKPEVQI